MQTTLLNNIYCSIGIAASDPLVIYSKKTDIKNITAGDPLVINSKKAVLYKNYYSW